MGIWVEQKVAENINLMESFSFMVSVWCIKEEYNTVSFFPLTLSFPKISQILLPAIFFHLAELNYLFGSILP